jgi:hypothetical protein
MALNFRPLSKTIDGADSSTTGVKLSYQAPQVAIEGINKRAYCVAATWRTNTGTVPTVQLQLLTKAGATIVIAQSDANGHIFIPGASLILMPGDTILFNVTAAGAGSNGDGDLSIDEVR